MTVQGDTWDMIAHKYFADGENGVSRLIAQNSLYADTVKFPAGIVLYVPDDSYEVSAVIPPWRR